MPLLSGFLTKILKSLEDPEVGIASAGTVTVSSAEMAETEEVVAVNVGTSRSPKPNYSPYEYSKIAAKVVAPEVIVKPKSSMLTSCAASSS